MRAGSQPASVPLRQKPRGIVSHFWRRILDLTLVLWVVRVPLLSVLLGLALMAGVTQAQDVTLDVAMAGAPVGAAAGLSRAILSLVAAVFLLWAMPVHYAARLLVETDNGLAVLVARRDASAGHRGIVGRDRLMAAMVREVPRLIGLAPFLAFAMGTNAAIGNLPTLADRPAIAAAHHQLVLLVWAMLAAVPLFYLYCVLRGRLTQVRALAALDRVLGRWLKPVFGLLAIAPRRDDAEGQLHASGRLALLFYALLVVAVLVASPHWLAARLPLAFAVPLIFGGWVPILAYLSSVGRRFHVPILTGLFIAGAIGVYVFGDNHAVRTVTADEPAYRRTSLVQAVHLWMRANGCAEQPSSCPRPVIVAAAGGASRAGFFTASVIGHFLDYDRQKQAFGFTRADGSKVSRAARDDGRFSAAIQSVLDGQERQGKNVATHLFALSGVSGGSYGAAVVAAALSARTGTAPPCPTEAPAHWFGGAIHGWRDCLESMTADDFLTATFFGLAFHDQVQLFLRDRAALLEEAWEASFARHVAAAGANAGPGAARRLSEPFLGAPRDPEHWVPYLVLNGTSVETGQRIITTDILPTYAASSRCPSGGPTAECPIFTHAIDFHSLVRSDLDVRLSTAATNSARFPVISPPGSIYQVDTDVVDRIVDGGYFENFGAESALELAQAMVDVEPALAPFVLVVSNDPQSVLTEERTARGVVVPDAAEHSFLPEVVGPVDAIGAVRSGRGRLAVAHAAAWLDGRFGGRCAVNLVQIKVWPEDSAGHCPVGTATPEKIRQVSMSWWLSKPVQMNLHEQLEPTADRCNNRTAVEQVWTALATRSEACTGPTP
ncbi:hypothetical protein [Xanthobacter aminoxidans]|uniref:hypothetical protein n=1 Tax=Xanthobacter aminoxidans TaxID=186280 RepID=UPI0037262C7B